MKNFFNTKSVRERVLMTAFLLIAAVSWGSSVLGRMQVLQSDWSATSQELSDQIASFNSKTQEDERAKKVTAQLVDPSRSLNATQLYAEVSRLAQGLQADLGSPRPTVGKTNFAINSLQATFRHANLEPLLKFYKELSAKAPYVGVEQCTITADRGSPGQITAVFRIYSVVVLSSGTKS